MKTEFAHLIDKLSEEIEEKTLYEYFFRYNFGDLVNLILELINIDIVDETKIEELEENLRHYLASLISEYLFDKLNDIKRCDEE